MLTAAKGLLTVLLMTCALVYLAINTLENSYSQAVGINLHDYPVNVRLAASIEADILGQLLPGNYVPVKEEGERWIQVRYGTHTAFVHRNVLAIGYTRVFRKWLITTQSLDEFEGQLKHKLLYLMLFLLLGLLLIYRKKAKPGNKTGYFDRVYDQFNVTESIDAAQSVIETQAEPPLPQKSITPSPAELLRPSKKQIHTQTLSEDQIRKIKQDIEKKFYQEAREEIHQAYEQDMLKMRSTIELLERKYEKARQYADAFGIDLEGSNIDNVVKGRQFELYAAQIWHDDPRVTIVDWTSDKGIKEGISVRSNGNPDFLIETTLDNREIAVECKYRTQFEPDKETGEPVFTTFDTKTKMERYQAYQEENQVLVYILLGVGGRSLDPDELFVVQIQKAIMTKHDLPYDGVINYKTTRNKLLPYKCTSDLLVETLL